jgi:hypothetical protein
VLFSNPDVAKFVRENFVAAWESVRPVPTVEIDFGNGTKLKRTVNGNIATYICAPDGRVLDIIPGLNQPAAYLQDLKDAMALYQAAQRDFDKVVIDFHKTNITTPTRYEIKVPDYSKSGIERPIKVAIDPKLDDRRAARRDDTVDPGKSMVETKMKRTLTDDEMLLAADTELNHKERKPMIHRMLAEKIVKPAEIFKRLYKDVLHCDLDDPYLGLVTKAFDGGAYPK